MPLNSALYAILLESKLELITDKNFKKWSNSRELPSEVKYSTRRSYIGLRLKSRPGVLFVTPEEVIHWTYDSKYCALAMFEDEIVVRIGIKDIDGFEITKMNIFWRIAFMGAKWLVRIRAGHKGENIIFYENPDEFVRVLKGLNIECV